MTMQERYKTLNHCASFWIEEKRLEQPLNAKAYRDRDHLILEIDTRTLIERCREGMTLSTSIPAATVALGVPACGSDTFRSLDEFPFRKPVVELRGFLA